MNAEELATLNEQIAGMARAGLPLDQGLASLAKDMGRGRLKKVTTALSRDLQAGQTLPDALNNRRSQLPPYYTSLVTAGLRTGKLSEVLQTLTGYARTVAMTRSTVIEALIYPIVVLILAAAVFTIIILVLIPQFEVIFKDFKMPLPWLTEVVLKIGEHPLELIVIPLAVLLVAFVVVRFLFRRTERGRVAWSNIMYSLPLVGTLIRSARLASFVDLLALMVDYSVPLPEAFQLAGDASSDPMIAAQARTVHDQLKDGNTLGEALRGHGVLPEWVAWMTAAGERAGALGSTLHQVAGVYRRNAEGRAAVLRNVLPSMLIIATAVILAGVFIAALVLPMIRLIDALAK